MKLALAADHAGFEMKEALKAFLRDEGHEAVDCGATVPDEADDYPDFIGKAARMVSEGSTDRAILLGGSGQGEAMVANRFSRVRAAVFYGGARDLVVLSREHNDANVLALGARFLSIDEAKDIVALWLATPFSGDARHVRRIQKIETEHLHD
ncbi:MAG: RpiB/LacA/LacB family sugar-phosphate isomerase [Patescibacteria group bacterium]